MRYEMEGQRPLALCLKFINVAMTAGSLLELSPCCEVWCEKIQGGKVC